MVVKTDPFVAIDEEYAKIYGILITRLGQFEKVMLNLVKRCDQKLSAKSLIDIYGDYGSDPLGRFVRFMDKQQVEIGKVKRSITVPKIYSKYKGKIKKFHLYRNEVVHSYYSQSKKGIHIRYIKKGKRKVTSLEKFIKEAKRKSSEIYNLSKIIDGLQR